MRISYDCPFCQALLPEGLEFCSVCGEKLNIAILFCSHPFGSVQSGASWPLYPKNYSVGSHVTDDIQVGLPAVPGTLFTLDHSKGNFKFQVKSSGSNLRVNKTQTSFTIQLGDGMLTLHYTADIKISEYGRMAPAAFMPAFSASCQMLMTGDLHDVFDMAVMALLRITGLEKGYYFSVSDDFELGIESAMTCCGADLDRRFCDFSGSVIQKAVVAENDIVCLDLDACSSHSMSDSMASLMLQKIICVPVKNNDGRVVGIIYGDAQRAGLVEANMSFFKPVLRMLAKMLSMRLSAV